MDGKPVMDVCREYWAENMDASFNNRAAHKVVELEREHGDGTHEMTEDVRKDILKDFKNWVDNIE